MINDNGWHKTKNKLQSIALELRHEKPTCMVTDEC